MSCLKFAEVSAVDSLTGKVKIDFIEDGITSDWLPFVVKNTKDNKYFYLPDIGEHVAALMDENLERGVILGAIYSTKNAPGAEAADDVESAEFSDGTVVKYDRGSSELTIDSAGDVIVMGSNISVIANTLIELDAPTVEITGDLQVGGDIDADGEVSAGQSVPATGVGLSTHVHAETGASTDGPTPGT